MKQLQKKTTTKTFEGRLWVTAKKQKKISSILISLGVVLTLSEHWNQSNWWSQFLWQSRQQHRPGKAASCVTVNVLAPKKRWEWLWICRHHLPQAFVIPQPCFYLVPVRLSPVCWDRCRPARLHSPCLSEGRTVSLRCRVTWLIRLQSKETLYPFLVWGLFFSLPPVIFQWILQAKTN